MTDGLTVEDFDVGTGPCPKCGRPAQSYLLLPVGIGIIRCEWPDCDLDADCSREAFFRTVWRSLTDEQKAKVVNSRF